MFLKKKNNWSATYRNKDCWYKCLLKKHKVCHGGVSLKEVDENLQLKKYSGIYVCGEALDVDGDCGGYNLHFCFLQVVCMWQNQ